MSRLDQLNKFHLDDPKNTFILFALAKEYEKLNQFERAKSHYHKVLELEPKYLGAYYHLGCLYVNNNMVAEGVDILNKGVSISKELNDIKTLNEINFILEGL